MVTKKEQKAIDLAEQQKKAAEAEALAAQVEPKVEPAAEALSLTDVELELLITNQKKKVQAESKKTLINKWEAGLYMTKEQLEFIKSDIIPSSVKTRAFRVNEVDKFGVPVMENGVPKFKMVDKFYNKIAQRIDTALDAGILDDEHASNRQYQLARNMQATEGKLAVVNIERSALNTLREEKARRAAEERLAHIVAKKYRTMSALSIYMEASGAKKLAAGDLAAHLTEVEAEIAATKIRAEAQVEGEKATA